MTDTQKVDREDFGFRGRIQPAQVLTTASLEGLLQIVWKSLSAVKTLGQSLSLPSSTRSNSPLLAPAGSCQRPARARQAWAGSVERSWENSRLEGLPPELPGGEEGQGPAGRLRSVWPKAPNADARYRGSRLVACGFKRGLGNRWRSGCAARASSSDGYCAVPEIAICSGECSRCRAGGKTDARGVECAYFAGAGFHSAR